ncbi:MAG: acyclic terpene utilization AtuA family protein, partial [Clostridia bacterium]
KYKTAIIEAEINKDTVTKYNNEGKVKPLYPAPVLTQSEIDSSVRVVAQMGVEPYIKALSNGAEVILAGRSYDPALFSALPVWKGYDMGLATHMGKILECACIACTPGSGSDCMIGFLGEDYFRVMPLSTKRKATTLSVAAHTLYEKTNPYVLPGPGGYLDLRETKFEQYSDNCVKVSGSKFVKSEKYTIKLEGVKCTGYRTVSIAGARDPIFIRKIDEILEGVRERVTDNFKSANYEYQLEFKIYGINGVMGALEPVKNPHPHELGIVIDCVAPTQEIANTICGFTRSTMLHYGYSERKATAGNLAFPYSPSDFKVGAVYEFSMYHVMEVEDPCSEFPQKMVIIDNGEVKEAK